MSGDAALSNPKKKVVAGSAAPGPKKRAPPKNAKKAPEKDDEPAADADADAERETKTTKKKPAAPRKRKVSAGQTDDNDTPADNNEDDDDKAVEAPKKTGRGAKKKPEADGSDDETGKPPPAKRARKGDAGADGKTGQPAVVDQAAKEKAITFDKVMSDVRRQRAIILDTRWNLAYTLCKKAKIAESKERWRQAISEAAGDKLTSDVVCLDPHTLHIEDPLVVVDIQPVRASPNFCFLTEREINLKLKNLLNTSILLGSSMSMARRTLPPPPTRRDEDSAPSAATAAVTAANAKKTFTPGEWVVWVRSGSDANAKHIAMTIATFAEIVRGRRTTQPITLTSPSGWSMFSEEDRIFVVPRDFLPPAAPGGQETPPPAVTPAVSLSQNHASILPPSSPPKAS